MKFSLIVSFAIALLTTLQTRAQDPLPSWNDGPAKQSIMEFVEKVTQPGSVDFVPPAERIATFDNDGCLWTEQPMYVQAFFIFDRVRALAPQHPEWKTTEPFASVLKGDLKSALSSGEQGIVEMTMATHAGMTTEAFEEIVDQWINTAKHPKTGKLHTEMVYQPMLELLDYLRANDFKTFIVSGGGIEFMRPWSQRVYGVPAEQVIGSSIKTKFEVRDGKPMLIRLPEINFVDDKEGKPVGIHEHIGRRPIMAFGNSDGDFQMLEWTTSGPGPRFGLYVHHTDSVREFAYDRKSNVGRLDRGLDEAASRGWIVVDMKSDWKVIYPYQVAPDASASNASTDHHYFAKESKPHLAHWGYEGEIGPQYWGRLDASYRLADTGKRQSPIDIPSAKANETPLPKLSFDYRMEQIRSRNNGHTIQHDGEPGSIMHIGDRQFALEQFHVHTPSEHTIDGKSFDMEIHFVHKSEAGQVVVVAVLVEAVNEGGLDIPSYTLPDQTGELIEYSGRKNPSDYLPKSREYFTYDGSFTTPPCTEGVKWIVMKQPLKAKPELVARFWEILKSNNRPVQALNDRTINLSE
jgi:carbonic anhydrase/phosphoserine phosphatase